MGRKRFLLVFAVFLQLFVQRGARATTLPMPSSLAEDVLSESVPTALAPNDFETSDFLVHWRGNPLPGAQVQIGSGTLEWVRVSEVLVLPRARLIVDIQGVDSGRVSTQGFSQPLTIRAGTGHAELPIALLSGVTNPIRLVVRRAGHDLDSDLEIRFHSSKRRPPKVFLDTSCSRFGVSAEVCGESADDWLYVGCRMVTTVAVGHRTSSVELYVYWDGVGQMVQVGGIDTPSSLTSTWLFRMNASPGEIRLKTGEKRVLLHYHAAEHLHFGSLGFGLGPYSYTFQSPFDDVASITAVVTVYGSYFITEQTRIVAFDATAVSSQLYTDFGIYLNTEYLRTLDRRIVLNLLLGGHVNGFRTGGTYHAKLGAPQGLEGTFIDAFKRGYNLSGGAFVYPPINGKSYYNLWLRWGSAPLFIELNYIRWRETLNDTQAVYTRTFGVSLGFPLLRFW